MLYAFKSELGAQTARTVIAVRERELRFFTKNIQNIGSQAALLSGFAFRTLVAHTSAGMLEWITEFAPTETFVFIWRYSGELDATQIAMSVLEILYLTSTISAMGSTLYTLYICLITPILGTGLALRGDEGAVDRAVVSLARVNTKVIRSFAYALRLFQFSVLMKAFLTFHLYAACVCACFVIYYFVSIQLAERRILSMFHITPSTIVTGRFDVTEASGRLRDLRAAAGLSPTPLAAEPPDGSKAAAPRRRRFGLGARGAASSDAAPTGIAPLALLARARSVGTFGVYKHDPYAISARDARHRDSEHAAVQKPTAVSEHLMYRHQGPLPPAVPPEAVL